MPGRTSPDTIRTMRERAQAAAEQYRRMTPEQRLAQFRLQGFHPHGVFLPDDEATQARIVAALKAIGAVKDDDERLRRYYQLQDACDEISKTCTGRWTGQQALARSQARFRLVAWGRRSGKTRYAANEGVAEARGRPRSVIWIAAQTYSLVDRAFSMVEQMLIDLGENFQTRRNTTQDKLLILENGSRIEGVSLENYLAAAGAAVDLAIVDEAAQVEEDAWVRAILPPLGDKRGRALLISSFEGTDTFFYRKAQEARDTQTWEVYQDPSWDVNFFMFPEGRESESLKEIEREINNPVDFLEQFGAMPARPKHMVFPEFSEKIHVGDWPYNPAHPVILAVDPSGGANAYAVAVLQDYKDYVVVVDEYYETNVKAEEVMQVLDRRPWRADVTDVVLDSAIPTEIERWLTGKWPAYPVFEKPKIEARIPLYRNLLRDPERFYNLYRREMNALLREKNREPDSDLGLLEDEQRALAIEVETRLSDAHLTPGRLAGLRACARLFVNSACAFTIEEHKRYKFYKPRSNSQSRNPREKPADSYNHILDALGYFTWTFHRHDHEGENRSYNTILPAGEAFDDPVVEIPRPVTVPQDRPSFLREMRSRYDSGQRRTKSILVAVS